MIVEDKLKALGFELLDLDAQYRRNTSGARFISHYAVQNLLYLSGTTPMKDGQPFNPGVVGQELTLEQGYEAARYATLASEMVAQGYGVYALDHRGHGRSPGPRANIERFAHLVSDLGVFVGRCSRQHLDTPVYLLGHSMGGAVAFESALRLQDSLRGLVLSAPALAPGDDVSPLREFAVRTLAVVAPGTGVLALPTSAVSSVLVLAVVLNVLFW